MFAHDLCHGQIGYLWNFSSFRRKDRAKRFHKYSIFNSQYSIWLQFTQVRYLPFGWGGRIRTSECGLQRPVSYHLTTPQYRGLKSEIRQGPLPKKYLQYQGRSNLFLPGGLDLLIQKPRRHSARCLTSRPHRPLNPLRSFLYPLWQGNGKR